MVAKKRPAQKSGRKKAAAKKPPVKKSVAKKAAVKKAAVKKAAVKKPAAKKPAAKKAAAKKAAAKKAVAKKPADTMPFSVAHLAPIESGRAVCDHPSTRSALQTFARIAKATGILTLNKMRREPTPKERDALWEVARACADRLYALDIEAAARQGERDHLAHYAIVALHWCDIYLTDPRHRMDDGRFRRDTLALALCLFTRVDPGYQWYAMLRDGWIAPHVHFSYLLWTLMSITQCNADNLFHRFTREEAQAALDRKQALVSPFDGYIPAEDEPSDSPLHRIWAAVRNGVLGPDGPHRFALNYIWNGPGLPGGMGLLPHDREMNKAYLQRVLEGAPIAPPSPPPEGPRFLGPPQYPGDWYRPNAHWNADGMILRIMNFPNIFADGLVTEGALFRRFTPDEVDRIAGKIRRTKTMILLPFVRDALASRFDLRGMRVPFWFIPFVAYGNDRGGVLYFEENGIHTNYEAPDRLGSTGHVDRWDHLSVSAGYNGLDWADEDDAILSSLRIEATSAAGHQGEFNIVEFHGPEHGATLHILLAIWEAVWQPVVERSRSASAFLKGPPPWPKAFESWDELVAWAETPDDPERPE